MAKECVLKEQDANLEKKRKKALNCPKDFVTVAGMLVSKDSEIFAECKSF